MAAAKEQAKRVKVDELETLEGADLLGQMIDTGIRPSDDTAREHAKDLIKNFVEQMVEAFRSRESLRIGVSPEGTRSKATHWRTGFYYIAVGAGVPVVLGYADYRRRIVGLGPTLHPTGDIEADFEHEFLERKTVFAFVNGFGLRADHFDAVPFERAVLVQGHRGVQRGLAAERGEQNEFALRAELFHLRDFARDDFLHRLGCNGFDVGAVGKLRVSLGLASNGDRRAANVLGGLG